MSREKETFLDSARKRPGGLTLSSLPQRHDVSD